MKPLNITYKNIFTGFTFCIALATISSCKKSFLDVPEQGQQNAQAFWQSAEDAAKGVNAIYGNLRSWENTAFPAIAIESMGSDEAEKGSSPTDASFFLDFDQFKIDPAQGNISGFWNGQYRNINYANQVLDNVPAITMDEGLKARYLGEAKFVRALSYFRLVRAFGGVPLRLHVPKDATEYNIPRASAAEVYAQIESDLTDAAAVLPQSYTATDKGRATKGAALALHAKVAMYLKKWSDVLDFTNQVMGLGYALLPNFEKVFRLENENSSESVFEIQAALIPGNHRSFKFTILTSSGGKRFSWWWLGI